MKGYTMSRFVISARDIRMLTYKPPRSLPGKGAVHGKAQGGKGGLQTIPPVYVAGARLPDVSLAPDDATARAKRRAILNIVADAALRQGISIEGSVEYRFPSTVESEREDLLREMRRRDAREEAQRAEAEERAALRRKAETSTPLTVCGKCAKVIATLFPGDAWRKHAEGCPERVIAWQAYMARNDWAKRGWQLRKDIAPPKDANAPKEEAQLTRTDLAETFNAAGDAIAESRADRSQYMHAGDYSDDHK